MRKGATAKGTNDGSGMFLCSSVNKRSLESGKKREKTERHTGTKTTSGRCKIKIIKKPDGQNTTENADKCPDLSEYHKRQRPKKISRMLS